MQAQKYEFTVFFINCCCCCNLFVLLSGCLFSIYTHIVFAIGNVSVRLSVIVFNILVQQTMISLSIFLFLSRTLFLSFPIHWWVIVEYGWKLAVDFVLRISNSLFFFSSFISSVNSYSLCSFFRLSYRIWREKSQ